MQPDKLRNVALGAGTAAAILAIGMVRLPRWLRIFLVLALASVAAAAAFLAYRVVSKPATLTVAAGSLDGETARLMTGIAVRLASTNAPVRLKVVDKGSVLEATKAFGAGEVDLAIVRPDLGALADARSIAIITYGTLLIVAPSGGPVKTIEDLKGRAVGVVGGEVNREVSQILAREYDFDRVKTSFVNLALNEIPEALQSRRVSALLVVMPLTDKYITMLRAVAPQKGRQQMVPLAIEAAGAIAAVAGAYESYDLPKGALRGSPPIPSDDMPTLRVPFYLVANRKLSEDVIGALTKVVIETRRDLVGEYPLLAQIKAPETDKDAYVPIHPGAAAYFEGEHKTFFDKFGDHIFYGSILLGALSSMLAAVWKFVARNAEDMENLPLDRLHSLFERVDLANGEDDLLEVESMIDDVLKREIRKLAQGSQSEIEPSLLGLTVHRLEQAIGRRRRVLELGALRS